MVSSFLSGAAPDLTTLIIARIFQGLGGGPIIPLSQAILWEIFPFHQRGLAMAVWGVGFILGPILGPTVGGYLADEWSWRWIFYINLPVGIVGFLMASAFLFDPPYLRKPGRIDWWGLGLMVTGFGCLQLVLDRGEREDWFDSPAIVAMTLIAVCALVGFLIRELMASEPILDLTVFTDRNFATGSTLIAIVGFGMFSGMLLVAVFTQKLLGYDAWTSGLVLAPGGLGNICSLFASGIVTRVDQRWMLAFGCLLNAVSLYMMTSLTLGMDYWALALPRFIQGFAVGFIFVPLSTLTLATIQRHKLVNATAVYGMLRNLGGSIGIAVVTTLLAQRSQFHQATLVSHITPWDPETQVRLAQWATHFVSAGQRRLHRRATGDGDALSRDGGAGPAPGLRGRLLAARGDVRDRAVLPAADASHPHADGTGDWFGPRSDAGAPGGGRRGLENADALAPGLRGPHAVHRFGTGGRPPLPPARLVLLAGPDQPHDLAQLAGGHQERVARAAGWPGTAGGRSPGSPAPAGRRDGRPRSSARPASGGPGPETCSTPPGAAAARGCTRRAPERMGRTA